MLGQKVIDLAGDAANGVKGHVGLTVDAPIPAVKEFAERFKKRFNYVCDHNGIKGYTGGLLHQACDRENRQVRQQGLRRSRARHDHHAEARARHLMEATWDKNGDIDRESFLGEVVGGKQKIVANAA